MNINKETITINNFGNQSLGLKIILATNSKTNSIFAIISDVNPASCCYQESIYPGDILFSINGIEINTFEKFYDTSRFIMEERPPVIQIMIIKKGVLDGSDLFKRCIDFPCTQLCQIWKEKSVRLKKRVDNIDRTVLQKESQQYTLKSTRTPAVDEMQPKLSSSGSIDEALVSDKFKSSNVPRIKYHQKAMPMMKKKKSSVITSDSSVNFTRKPTTRMSTVNMIASPEPHFIRRPNARTYENVEPLSNIKQAKSLTNLTNINVSSHSSETSSTSSSSISSPLETNSVPTKTGPAFKPIPMPRAQVPKLSHQRSFESRDFSSLSTYVKYDRQFQPVVPNDRPTTGFSKELMVSLKDELKKVRQQNDIELPAKDYSSVNYTISSKLPPNRGTDF